MSDAQKPLPDRLLIFRRVGSDRPHVGEDGETMSWANADGQAYVRGDLHEAVKAENERLRRNLSAILDALDAVDREAERADQPGATAWSSAPVVALLYKRQEARAALKGETP